MKQSLHLIVTTFDAYIVTTYKCTEIASNNKRMFFWTVIHQVIPAAVWKVEDHVTFDTYLEAGVKAETALWLNVEYNIAFKSTSK
jgi:hypothetical protein